MSLIQENCTTTLYLISTTLPLTSIIAIVLKILHYLRRLPSRIWNRVHSHPFGSYSIFSSTRPLRGQITKGHFDIFHINPANIVHIVFPICTGFGFTLNLDWDSCSPTRGLVKFLLEVYLLSFLAERLRDPDPTWTRYVDYR